MMTRSNLCFEGRLDGLGVFCHSAAETKDMLQMILNEILREGINVLEYADENIRQANEAELIGDNNRAGYLRLQGHAHREAAGRLAWIYSRTVMGACAQDIIDLWNNIRNHLGPDELARLCGVGFMKSSGERKGEDK